MENLVYLKVKSEVTPKHKLEKWFGVKYLMTKPGNSFFLDSSLNKQMIKKKLVEKKLEILLQRHSIAKRNLGEVLSQLQNISLRKVTDRIEHCYNLQRQNELQVMEKSAIKIQAFVRGFMIRKKFEELLITISKSSLFRRMNSLTHSENYCFLNVGVIVKNAATKLQRAIRRCLFRMKMRRIQDAYLAYLEDLKAPLYNYLSRVLLVFHCKDKVKHARFESYRANRLEQIRKRLALLTIRAFLKKKKLTVRGLRNKIKRYKRLLKYSHQTSLAHGTTIRAESEERKYQVEVKPPPKTLYTNMNSTSPIPGDQPHMSTFITTNLELNLTEPLCSPDTDPFKGETQILSDIAINNSPIIVPEQRVQNSHEISLHNETHVIVSLLAFQQNQKNAKIKAGLSSLGIHKAKEGSIIPILYQKELDSRPETHHFNLTSACISRMLGSTPSRQAPKMEHDFRIRVQSAVAKPRSSPTYHYLNQTICSKLKIEDSDEESEEKPSQAYYISKKFNKIIFKPRAVSSGRKAEKNIPKPKIIQRKPAKKDEVLVPNLKKGSFKMRAEVKYIKNSRVQTPKSTKSCAVRRQSAQIVRRNSDFNPVTLTFEAALPEYSEMLTSLIRPLYLQLRPKTGNKLA